MIGGTASDARNLLQAAGCPKASDRQYDAERRCRARPKTVKGLSRGLYKVLGVEARYGVAGATEDRVGSVTLCLESDEQYLARLLRTSQRGTTKAKRVAAKKRLDAARKALKVTVRR